MIENAFLKVKKEDHIVLSKRCKAEKMTMIRAFSILMIFLKHTNLSLQELEQHHENKDIRALLIGGNKQILERVNTIISFIKTNEIQLLKPLYTLVLNNHSFLEGLSTKYKIKPEIPNINNNIQKEINNNNNNNTNKNIDSNTSNIDIENNNFIDSTNNHQQKDYVENLENAFKRLFIQSFEYFTMHEEKLIKRDDYFVITPPYHSDMESILKVLKATYPKLLNK